MIKQIFRYLSFIILIKVLWSVILILCSQYYTDIFDIINSEIEVTNDLSKPVLLTLLVIVIPITEEIAFRGYLNYKNHKLIKFSLPVLFVYLFILIIGGISKINLANVSILISILIPIQILIHRQLTKICLFIKVNQELLVVLSSLAFGALHLTNFSTEAILSVNIFAIILSTTPTILIGYILAKSRINCGIISSIFLHIINNSFLLFV